MELMAAHHGLYPGTYGLKLGEYSVGLSLFQESTEKNWYVKKLR